MRAQLLVSVCLAAVLACRPYDEYQQTKTVANMRAIASALDRNNAADLVRASAAIKSVGHGVDAWGNDFVYKHRVINGRSVYVLISVGNDNRLDDSTFDTYFLQTTRDVHGNASHDLVIRDGELITLAGK